MNGMIRAAAVMLLALSMLGADATIRVTGQLLDYQQGYVFFTTGDGFRVAPNVRITNAATGTPTTAVPMPRDWARATFDASGTVVELDLSKKKLPPEGNFADVRSFVVALSPAAPNPDLGGPKLTKNGIAITYSGKIVPVHIVVEVPPTTPLSAQVYMTTDQAGWNPQAYRMSRTDALHYKLDLRLPSGTVLNLLFTRGSMDTEQRGPGGMQMDPATFVVKDADVSTKDYQVYAWADQSVSGQFQQPLAIPTPYNSAPFPNLPNGAPGAPRPTPHP